MAPLELAWVDHPAWQYGAAFLLGLGIVCVLFAVLAAFVWGRR